MPATRSELEILTGDPHSLATDPEIRGAATSKALEGMRIVWEACGVDELSININSVRPQPHVEQSEALIRTAQIETPQTGTLKSTYDRFRRTTPVPEHAGAQLNGGNFSAAKEIAIFGSIMCRTNIR